MTVKELIETLALFPPDMQVAIRSPTDPLQGFNVGAVRMDLGKPVVVRGKRCIRFGEGEGVVLKPEKGERDMIVIDTL